MSSSNAITALVITLMSISRWQLVTSFAPSSTTRSHHPQHAVLTKLPALIYYPDGDGAHYEDGSSPSTPVSSSTSIDDVLDGASSLLFDRLASRLSSDLSVTPALARVASAHSPLGFAIDLANVNDVRCSSLDGRRMEIEAVVCDVAECSSLLVPVDFPEECDVGGGGGDEGGDDVDVLAECVLRNVEELDVVSSGVFAEEEEARRAMEALRSLDSEYLQPYASSPPGSSLPGWWVAPHSSEDVSECALLEDLLNGQDMRDMMRGLATHALGRSGGAEEGGRVDAVRVRNVGPLGMILKVQISAGGKTWEDDWGLHDEAFVDVPIKFDEMIPAAYGGDGDRSIREEVLMIVSAVNAP